MKTIIRENTSIVSNIERVIHRSDLASNKKRDRDKKRKRRREKQKRRDREQEQAKSKKT
jgi:hypothetical protein